MDKKGDHVLFVRLNDGIKGKMQAIKYHQMFKATIQFRDNKYIAAIDTSDKEIFETAKNYTDYLFGPKRISERSN